MIEAISDKGFERPPGIAIIAIVFFLASAYLLILGVVRLANPNAVSLSMGAPLLHGLELAGPYMFLLSGLVGALVALGLLRLKNIARRAAIAITVAGIVLLIPKVSGDAFDLSLRLLLAGAMVMVRVAIVWYLWQGSTAVNFH